MKPHILWCAALCASCSSKIGPVVPQTPVERQMIGLLQKFDHWDDDGDGELDHQEIANGLKSTQNKPQQVNYKPQQVIDFYDTDHSGKISLAEAQAGYARSSDAESRLQH